MKKLAVATIGSITIGMFGCAAPPGDEAGVAENDLRAKLGANEVLRCDADSGKETLALVATAKGKVALLALTPAADLYALSGTTGTLTSSASTWSWKAAGSSLTVGASSRGKWLRGSKSTNVTCRTDTAETASWRVANALVDYAAEIDGLAETVLEESNDPKPKPYTVFAVETARRGSIALGTIAKGSAGALPGEDGESALDEDDFSYGAISAAYSLGGGDDYGEWFQGASDGISLSGSVTPALPAGARVGFIAHENVTALASLVDRAKPSAVEITLSGGAKWTFLLPDGFTE